MNKRIRNIIIILLLVGLCFAMISCTETEENLPPIDEGITSPLVNVNKNDMMNKIKDGMIKGSEELGSSEENFIDTTYTIHTGYINYTFDYVANYAKKRQDSEIFLKIFDNNQNMNRIFVYYNKGDLFIQSQGEKKSIANFGSTTSFDLFYETIVMFDISNTFISVEMADLFDPGNIGANISTLVDQKRINYIKVSENLESIEMTKVNLNYGQIKKIINEKIQGTFGKFESKFDLLSLKYFGIRISDLAILEVSTILADMINVRMYDGSVQTVIFSASGAMADSNNFTVDIEVNAKTGKDEIEIEDSENPYLDDYPSVIMGRYNYGGTLYVPFFDMTYDATLRTKLSSKDNTLNDVLFTIDSIDDEMGGMFYKDQMLYVDISGMQDQLNGAIELGKLNLPRVKFDGINLSQEITLLINDAIKIVQSMNSEDEYGEKQELFQIFLDNMESDEETNTIKITITKELIEQLYGEDIDIVTLIAEKLEIDPALLSQILGDNALQNTVIELLYNVETEEIGVDLYDNSYLIFQLRMSPIDPEPNDTITYPDSFNTTYYKWLEIPDNTIITIDGILSVQEVSEVNFDEFFGALFGDISGINTPYILASDEQLEFSIDMMQIYNYTENDYGDVQRETEKVINIEVFKNDILQLGVYSSDDPEYILVYMNFPVGPEGYDRNGEPYIQQTLKYRIKREKVKEAFNSLLGEDNIFSMENISDILASLLKSVRNSTSMQLRFVDSSFAFNLISDSVEELIGIDHLNALIKTRMKFAITDEEYLNNNILESQFVLPKISQLENEKPNSIYETQWKEYVYTYFGDKQMKLKLTFNDDSSKIISGKYFYKPQAKLLGENVYYYVTIKDQINGIKLVESILNPNSPHNQNAVINENNPIQIDPSLEEGLPIKIPVLYDDGTFGEVNYFVEDFDVSNITVAGMPKENFWLVIGKDSIAEKRFYISIEVLSRIIVPLKTIINSEVQNMISDEGYPVVGEITIDPYTYAIKKSENSLWSPLPSSLVINFETLDGTSIGESMIINDVQWDFKFNKIKYNGGVFFTHANYNKLTIAMKINVKSKIVSYVKFVDAINTNLPENSRPYTEVEGCYTVDVLQSESYIFPNSTTEKQEMRLYFEDGTYRIIGSIDHNYDDEDFYNEYLPLIVNWEHPYVEQDFIKLVGTHTPLGNDDKNINKATIGSESFSIGSQEISLNIDMPSRAMANIGVAGNIHAIYDYEKNENDEYIENLPLKNYINYDNASFSKEGELGSFFEFNPYNQKPLPQKVYIEIMQGGRIQRKAYDIQWKESGTIKASHTYDIKGNIVSTEYYIRFVSTDEQLLMVQGILGDNSDEDLKIELTMIVKNLDAIYQDITFEGMDTNDTDMDIDPYKEYNLPSYYSLMLKNGSIINVDNVSWYIILEEGENWMLQFNGEDYSWVYDYIDYLEDFANGNATQTLEEILPYGQEEPSEEELEYYKLILEKGELLIDNSYKFPYNGGSYTIKSYVEANENVIEQEVFLTLDIMPRNILITNSENDYTQIDIFNSSTSQYSQLYDIDTYELESSEMLDRLQFLLEKNDFYDNTLAKIYKIIIDLRKANSNLNNIELYALCYNEYYNIAMAEEKTSLLHYYDLSSFQNAGNNEEYIKYIAIKAYMENIEERLEEAKIGIYFGDNPETSMEKYILSVRWINLQEIIDALEHSDGAVLGVVLEGYIGYGKINQQLIRMPFKISRREIVSFSFNNINGYDSSVFSIDYRYVYISDEDEATSLINSIIDSVLADDEVAQNQKSQTIYNTIYNHIFTTDNDRLIMDSVEEDIQDEDPETRYGLIIEEILRLRKENIRTIFIEMYKPMGLTQLDSEENEIFIAPSDYFYNVFSEVSLMFADRTEGYYIPRYQIGTGVNLAEQKDNFNQKILATNMVIANIEIDPMTGERYAYVDIAMPYLSKGSCSYPITIRFKAIVDTKGVVDGYPSTSELEPYDENGNPRFTEGYKLPNTITINYEYSGDVTFGNISSWMLNSPLAGLQEGKYINTIPVKNINVLNPSIIDLKIGLPCEQGDFAYHINFPQKYIGKVFYNAETDDRNYSTLDIENGIITIENIYEIYDPTKPVGFDTTKLPSRIVPFAYDYGEAVFKIGGTNVDTFYSITNNNIYEIEWELVSNWANGSKINHNGTMNENGEIVPVLFAKAKIFSYYYYESEFAKDATLFEQEIELYIKVKPLLDPIISYEGLVNFSDNNNISFDPYNDPNNYGGNIILPKDGLTVYFNNNLQDKVTFGPRDLLKYYLLMGDSQDISKAEIFDSLNEREDTGNEEKIVYYKNYIDKLENLYAGNMGITKNDTQQYFYSLAFDTFYKGSGLLSDENYNQRMFLNYFVKDYCEEKYSMNSLNAWYRLMGVFSEDSERLPIMTSYLKEVPSFDNDIMIEDIKAFISAYNNFISNDQNSKDDIVNLLIANVEDSKKVQIIVFLNQNNIFSTEIGIISANIDQEGQLTGEVPKKIEIFNRLMEIINVESKFDIFRQYLQQDENVHTISISSNESIEEIAKAFLLKDIIEAVYNNTNLLEEIAMSFVETIDDWKNVSDKTDRRMWEIYLNKTIEEGNYNEIINLTNIYLQAIGFISIDSVKAEIVESLINSDIFNSGVVEECFDIDGQLVHIRVLDNIINIIESNLQSWQIKRAKAYAWDEISLSFEDDSILTRIINGNENSIEKLNTEVNNASSYDRLKQSEYYSLFIDALNQIELSVSENNLTKRKSIVFTELYNASSLSEKIILVEIMMGAYKSISDGQVDINTISYNQDGHCIAEIDEKNLKLYLYLPDNLRIEINLVIYSRDIKDVLVPNIITTYDDEGKITTNEIKLKNVYYIDPYNSETFKLPQKAEFDFESGENLVLDIDSWTDYDLSKFYTRYGTDIYYYNKNEDSYKGGVYTLASYLTYGTGSSAERQIFEITVIVLNRSLNDEYSEVFKFENPVAGRVADIPDRLTSDMFVDFDKYYKNDIDSSCYYSNFGMPIIPQIIWNKTSYNENGATDSDILVQGGFDKDIQGFLSYDNNLLINTYNGLWNDVYNQYASITKPLAWEKCFETMLNGERIVVTAFAGKAGEQLALLDNEIYNDLYIEAYNDVYENTNNRNREDIYDLMISIRNKYFYLDIDEDSEWYVIFYKDLKEKAQENTLTDKEENIWDLLYKSYVELEIQNINQKRVEKWDIFIAMEEIWDGNQKELALSYLNNAYNKYRDAMLIQTWEDLEYIVRICEAEEMDEVIDRLRDIYGSTEEAKIKAWDYFKNKDKIKSIWGQSANINIIADEWTFVDIRNIADEVISEITFNGFTENTNDFSYIVNFESLNTLLLQKLEEKFDETKIEMYANYGDTVLDVLKNSLLATARKELISIDDSNYSYSGSERKIEDWNDIYNEKMTKATSPIDNTRIQVEIEEGVSGNDRDYIVWSRLTEGAVGTSWAQIMNDIWTSEEVSSTPIDSRYTAAVNEYREERIEIIMYEFYEIYNNCYDKNSINAWDNMYLDPNTYSETTITLNNVLFKDIAENAWNKLYNYYSTVQEKSTMSSFPNINEGDLKYIKAWNNYYSSMPAERKELMDYILNYEKGYGYCYNELQYFVLQETLDELYEQVDKMLNESGIYNFISSGNETIGKDILIKSELADRYIAFDSKFENIFNQYFDDYKIAAWHFVYDKHKMYEHNEIISAMDNLLPEDIVKEDSWETLWENRGHDADEDIYEIDNIFNTVIEESQDKIYAEIYDELNEDALKDIYFTLDENQCKEILWSTLYNISDSEDQLAMDKVEVKQLFLGLTEENCFDIYYLEESTSQERRELMNDLLETYKKSRALEIYRDMSIENASIYEKEVYDLYKQNYVEYLVWNEVYQIESENGNTDRTVLMDNILADVYNIYYFYYEDEYFAEAFEEFLNNESITIEERIDLLDRIYEKEIAFEDLSYEYKIKAETWDIYYENANASEKISMQNILNNYNAIHSEQIRKAHALDDESTIALLNYNVQEVEDKVSVQENSLNQIKAEEWDNYFINGTQALRTAMNNIYNEYSFIENEINQKANALDDVDFRNLIGSSENALLQQRIDNQENDLIDIYFGERAYENILDNSLYTDLMDELYTCEYNKELILYLGNIESLINKDRIKRNAYYAFKDKNENDSIQYYKQLIEDAKIGFEQQFKQDTWDRYMLLMGAENPERQDFMISLLENEVLNCENNIKVYAIEKLYDELQSDSIEKINDIRNNVETSIRENELWLNIFGENSLSFNNKVDEIEAENNGAMSIFEKSNAWDNLYQYYQDNIILKRIFDEMIYSAILNDSFLYKSNCWNLIKGITENIKYSFNSRQVEMEEDSCRVAAIEIMLERLSGKEKIILQNAIENISISQTENEIYALAFDDLYKKSVPDEKEILDQLINSAIENYGGTSEDDNIKSIAFQCYSEYKQHAGLDDIVFALNELGYFSFGTLEDNEKIDLYNQLYVPKEVDSQTFYCIKYAEQYWNHRTVDADYGRQCIFWDQNVLDGGGDIANIYLGNGYKAYDNEDEILDYQTNVFVAENYIYKNKLIQIEFLDFYGELNGENYYNELVIDPLNPQIPTEVDAYGIISGITTDIDIYGTLYSYIGKVQVSFEDRINDYLYDEEGTIGEFITATITPALGEDNQNINIKVYYLNRQPTMYYTNTVNYTIEELDENLNLYPLTINNSTNNKIITIDPLNQNIFDVINKEYVLPSSLVVNFTDTYPEGVIASLFANGTFAKRLDITDISWDRMGNVINLDGCEPSSIKINSYSIDQIEMFSTDVMDENFWKLEIEVLERKIDRILSVNQQGLSAEEIAIYLDGVLSSVEAIDPYNVTKSFPENVKIEFVGGSNSKLLTDVTWKFAEGRGLDYLKLPEVITGSIGESAMFLTAGFTCISETIWINFPIKNRHIDITIEGTEEIKLIDGGTLFLIKGEDLHEQLSNYSSLYYNFSNVGQEADWSEVPLEFIENDVSQVSTADVGSYTVRGRLGPINDANIVFEIIVIDPKLYANDIYNEINKKVYYDKLTIATNSYGIKIKGKEEEEGFLPEEFVQFPIYDESNDMVVGYNSFEIIDTFWDVVNKKVDFTCEYIFLDESDDIDRLGGLTGGGHILNFIISIPLETFIYTEVDDNLIFEADNGTNSIKLDLGEILKISDLPRATMNKGGENEFQISLLWDLSTINVNKAGTYDLYGYYRDYTSSFMSKSKHLIVVIDKIDISDEITTKYSLNQTYTGLNIEVTPLLPDVLRSEGSYDQLVVGNQVIVEYLTEEKYLKHEFGFFKPIPYKNAGNYYVRITIDDYNIIGEKIFLLTIEPIIIDPDDIIFDYGEGSSSVAVDIPEWPQTEKEKLAMYYEQFILLADSKYEFNAMASAYDTLFTNVNSVAQAILTNELNTIITQNHPDFDTLSNEQKASILLNTKTDIWENIASTGTGYTFIAPNWPHTEQEKNNRLDNIKSILDDEGEAYSEQTAKALAYDQLYEDVIDIGKILMYDNFDAMLAIEYPNFHAATEAEQSTMIRNVKALVWDEINFIGIGEDLLVPNWPKNDEEKLFLLFNEYFRAISNNLDENDKNFFIQEAKANMYDILKAKIYSSAQEKLEEALQAVININFPLFDEYYEDKKQLLIVEAKSLVWDNLVPGDTIEERSYVYDGKEHLPIINGMPQVQIIDWPKTLEEKNILLNNAINSNPNYTLEQAKAKAFDNLDEMIHSNIYALGKLTYILIGVIKEFYPEFYNQEISNSEKQNILISAKAKAWENRIIPGDTVQEVYYTFSYWYADMNNNGSIINSCPKNAGTYEIKITIDPALNRNYRLKEGSELITTISIRRAEIDLSFANEMIYSGTSQNPISNGLHNEEGELPDGVTIEYTFMKDGQNVDNIRDVGSYIFSAVVDGGNNYPSWSIENQFIEILPKDLIINVGEVESGYLEELKSFNSSFALEGIVGDDMPSMFGYVVCDSLVTDKHMVGEYEINFVGFKKDANSDKIYYLDALNEEDDLLQINPTLYGNYNITVNNGIYKILKLNEQAITINDTDELNVAYNELNEGETALWYLAPGNYGDFVIDKNVGITIIGCYDNSITDIDYPSITDKHMLTMNEVRDNAQSIGTSFDSITINAGALTLEIIKFVGDINSNSIYINKDATTLSVKRCLFIHNEITGEGGEPIIQNSKAIVSNPSFNGLLRIERTYFEGYTIAVYMNGSKNFEIINSRFNDCKAGIKGYCGDVHIEGCHFEYIKGDAVYLEMVNFTVINCSFESNEVAIKSLAINSYDLWLENSFKNNVIEIDSI